MRGDKKSVRINEWFEQPQFLPMAKHKIYCRIFYFSNGTFFFFGNFNPSLPAKTVCVFFFYILFQIFLQFDF